MRTEATCETDDASEALLGESRALRVPEDVLFREISGEAVVLQLDTGCYFGLDEMGAKMWALLNQHGDLDTVFRELLGRFEVEPERLARDLTSFVEDLLAHRLLESDAP